MHLTYTYIPLLSTSFLLNIRIMASRAFICPQKNIPPFHDGKTGLFIRYDTGVYKVLLLNYSTKLPGTSPFTTKYAVFSSGFT